jgi:hypothetical protein
LGDGNNTNVSTAFSNGSGNHQEGKKLEKKRNSSGASPRLKQDAEIKFDKDGNPKKKRKQVSLLASRI